MPLIRLSGSEAQATRTGPGCQSLWAFLLYVAGQGEKVQSVGRIFLEEQKGPLDPYWFGLRPKPHLPYGSRVRDRRRVLPSGATPCGITAVTNLCMARVPIEDNCPYF